MAFVNEDACKIGRIIYVEDVRNVQDDKLQDRPRITH